MLFYSKNFATFINKSLFICSYVPGSPGVLPFKIEVSINVPHVCTMASDYNKASLNDSGSLASPLTALKFFEFFNVSSVTSADLETEITLIPFEIADLAT